ncbi:MAG: tetratricopeptide repeat protein, partial [Myxococcales bacterium]|nr:tetratricopeptide repeat protein [Myxococcales bacterium]
GQLDPAIERYLHAANLLLQANDAPQALQVFRQVLSLAPERYDVHLHAAQAFETLRRVPEAVALYEQVAGVYLRSGNTREALMLYERVADLMPREVSKRLRLAELFSRERRVDDAVDHFQRSADFLRKAKRDQEFVRVAERLLYHRSVDEVIRQLVRVYLDIDQPRRALMKLNELLQRQHTDIEGLELLAETFAKLDRVEKTISVVQEVIKLERDKGAEGLRHCVKILRKAVVWAPDHGEFKTLLAELDVGGDSGPQPAAAAGDDDDIEEIEELDDLEELDEFDELDDDDAAPSLEPVDHGSKPPARPKHGPRPTPPPQTPTPSPTPSPPRPPAGDAPQARRHSLTEEVISEGAQRSGGDDGEIDFDKQLEEVRVLMKYHLFEHAMGHADQILAVAPRHLQALELKSEILAGLERNAEAADLRVTLANLLITSDPRTAARHVELAQALAPGHAKAAMLAEQLADIPGIDVGTAEVEEAQPSDDDPLSGLVLDDDPFGSIEASESLVGDVSDVLSAISAGRHTELHYSEPDPEPDPIDDIDLDEPELGNLDDSIDIRSADPSLHGELNRLGGDSDFAISIDSNPALQVEEAEDEIAIEDRFGLGEGDEDEPGEDETTRERPTVGLVGRVEP